MTVKRAAGSGFLKTVAIFMLSSGASYINNGDYLVGGLLATVGFILLVVDTYVSG